MRCALGSACIERRFQQVETAFGTHPGTFHGWLKSALAPAVHLFAPSTSMTWRHNQAAEPGTLGTQFGEHPSFATRDDRERLAIHHLTDACHVATWLINVAPITSVISRKEADTVICVLTRGMM